MPLFKQQKTTDRKKNLANKIKQLEYEILALPAYSRRKKNRKIFDAIFVIAGLTGIVIFGAGWLAVALLGTVSSAVIVESGLFLSLGIGLSTNLLYRVYIGIQNLFASEKIKIQNKEYDNHQKNLTELRGLYWKNVSLSKQINNTLSRIRGLDDLSIREYYNDFLPLGLHGTLQHLETRQRKHPAYSRRQKDKENWKRIKEYFLITSLYLSEIYTLGCLLLLSVYMALPIITFPLITVIILLVPIIVSKILYVSYLWVRDRFSSKTIKSENNEYDYLKKMIDQLSKLSHQQDKLDKIIAVKLQELGNNDFVFPDTVNDKSIKDEKQSSGKNSVLNDNPHYYGSLFKTLHTAEEDTKLIFSMDFSRG